jgi:hypothetical protein
MSQTRRLAAILAADVAGYSRLMGADEEGTLERPKALRRELLDPKITDHRGRIVKTTGDGMLVEFASVVDAVTASTSRRGSKPWPMPAGCSSPIRSTITCATGCPSYLRIWANSRSRTLPGLSGSFGSAGPSPTKRASAWWVRVSAHRKAGSGSKGPI